jgi:hypothetical protein
MAKLILTRRIWKSTNDGLAIFLDSVLTVMEDSFLKLMSMVRNAKKIQKRNDKCNILSFILDEKKT